MKIRALYKGLDYILHHLGYQNTASLISLVLFLLGSVIFHYNVGFFVIIFLVLFIHEWGHYLASKYFSYSGVKMIFILPLGGMVTGSKCIKTLKEELIIYFAGPLPGIIIGLLVYLLYVILGISILRTTALIFIIFNGINLFPAYPLDGAMILRLLFLKKIVPQKIISAFSAGGLLVFIIFSKDPVLLIVFLLTLADLVVIWTSRLKVKESSNLQEIEWKAKYNILKKFGIEKGDSLRSLEYYNDIGKSFRIGSVILYLLLIACFPVFMHLIK